MSISIILNIDAVWAKKLKQNVSIKQNRVEREISVLESFSTGNNVQAAEKIIKIIIIIWIIIIIFFIR